MHSASLANEGYGVDNIINNLNKMPIATIATEGFEKAESKGVDESPHSLRIFVSTSMQRTLLREYAFEAKKYNGVLVFKGLPDGSFKAMSDLVQYLSKDQNVNTEMDKNLDHGAEENLAIQIDDEEFDKYNVTSVPTFVLSKEQECSGGMSCKNLHDKISGNIGIKSALEKFAQNGDLKKVSAQILQEAEQ